MIKTLHCLVIEGIYLNVIKIKCGKPTANIMLNRKELNAFRPKSERMPSFTSSIQYSTGSPNQSNYARKRTKVILIRKKKVKFSLFADNIILYVENTKDYTIKVVNKFSTVVGYKINT